MNQKILVCIPYCANDAVQAERACDHVYRLNGKKSIGHVLLVVNDDVHAEMRMKVKIAAELAYETVEETIAPKVAEQYLNDKFRQVNNLFRHAAMIAMHQFRWPWVWLEPDCVPVKPSWMKDLAEAYEAQPRKYLGLISSQPGGQKFMARCGVYFTGASFELDKLCQGDAPFPLITSTEVVRRATPTDLIQYLNISTVENLSSISKSAVLVHGDKMGIFSENWKPPETSVEGHELFSNPTQDLRSIKDPKKQLKAILGGIKKMESDAVLKQLRKGKPL